MTCQLAGKRILIIEDEYFIASDLSRALAEEQAIIVGPVGEVDQGLSMLGANRVDAAILDVNLRGETSFAIADELADSTTPYLFITGYDTQMLPESYRGVPRVTKPFPLHAVVSGVKRLLAAGGTA